MRKLTGYIGAMIIVFALMGSILAGYALNINGTNTVMNEYEKVTDVSGLYSHTQEPTYIDYNPASNYTGYSINQADGIVINNVTQAANGRLYYNLYKNGCPDTLSWNNSQYAAGAFYHNGTVVGYSTTGDVTGVRAYYPIVGENITAFRWMPDGTNPQLQINAVVGGTSNTYYSSNLSMTYTSGTIVLNMIDLNLTVNITSNWLLVPTTGGTWAAIVGNGIGYTQYSDFYTPDPASITKTQVDTWNGEPVFNFYSIKPSINNWAFVPYQFTYQPTNNTGINYTESTRVNNYLMETEYQGGSTSVITQKLNLTPGMGLTDYCRAMGRGDISKFWRANYSTYVYNGTNTDVSFPSFTSTNQSSYVDNIREFSLSDILGYYNIQLDKKMTIRCYGTNNFYLDDGQLVGDNNFTKFIPQLPYGSPGFLRDKQYCVYDPDTELFTYYDQNGVSYGTYSTCYVAFCGSNARYGAIMDWNYNIVGWYDFGTSRPTPYIEITYETQNGGTTVYHYADITKGYSIKSDNTDNVTWNNEYNNGVINILFRADDVLTTYSNDIIIGSNNISIDYSTKRFYVTLNGADPVDIGTWRNFVLSIDMINGKLSAIPVRTFNSYTNVVLDETNIIIGDLVNPTPTNTIQWLPTNTSLMFNVYSTSVFMNTYGVVMVDPTLDVTDYFTNLDNFYQLRLSNFSIYGQSMTINGVTGNVTGNTISFNNETIQIKEMEITYADGNVTISDSYATIDLGAISDTTVSMTGAWYFITDLYSGHTIQKTVYDWDWGQFILDDKAFGVIYIGLCLIGLLVARHFCTLTVTDYIIFVLSIVFALTVPVIA